MAIQTSKLQLEKHKFDQFMKKFKNKEFGTQRLGQAMSDHFKLDRLANQEQLQNLYAKDGEQAFNLIKEIFTFN